MTAPEQSDSTTVSPADFQFAIEETPDSFGETFEFADVSLDPTRDEDGELPQGYEGYLHAHHHLVIRMHDLSRELSFGLPPAYQRPSIGGPASGGQDK